MSTLLLLSGIGEPYDPATNTGVTGKNYAYQMNGGVTMFFKDANFNPFIGHGSNGFCIDDFSVNQNDFGALGFIGGAYWRSGTFNGQPIRSMILPAGTPAGARTGRRPLASGMAIPCPSAPMARTWHTGPTTWTWTPPTRIRMAAP